MSDKSDESYKKKGFFINSKGVACIPCRCKRQSYHKETKTIKENNIITTNIVEDRHNMKFGATVDMYHLMKTTYSKMIIKWEALRYAILVLELMV